MMRYFDDTIYLAFLSFLVVMFLLFCGCAIVTAPTSVSWRSNANLQVASTEGQTHNAEGSPSVNADKTTETQAAVNTSSGSAATASQSQSNAEEKK